MMQYLFAIVINAVLMRSIQFQRFAKSFSGSIHFT